MFQLGDHVRVDRERRGVVAEQTPDGVFVQLNDGQGPALRIYVARSEYHRLELLED